MDIKRDGDTVAVVMTREEAARLGFAMRVGYEAISRAEFYIRSGLSQPIVREIGQALIAGEERSIELTLGAEEIENPRRARPGE